MTPATLSIYVGREPVRTFDVNCELTDAEIGMAMSAFMPELLRKGRVAIAFTVGNLVKLRVTR